MHETWAKWIPPAWVVVILLAIGSRAGAEPPADSPRFEPAYAALSAGAPQRLLSAPEASPRMLAVPPRADGRVVPVRWETESAGAPPSSSVPGAKPLSPPNRPPRLLPPSSGKTLTPESKSEPGSYSTLFSTAGGLGIVIGIFLLGVWIFRRSAPQGMARLPGEVFENLGRAPLAGRLQVHLLRCGNKLLLVSLTPAGAETLTEITDPLEVDRLAGCCRQTHPQSSSAAFRQVFEQLAPRRAGRGIRDQFTYRGAELDGFGLGGGGSP
ncbi:MAG: flagellar biosynthetic protein FliO [Pirellulales bacterium]|nr:flagellar biosynthetic protein FliO [Pirellulales bacterium]